MNRLLAVLVVEQVLQPVGQLEVPALAGEQATAKIGQEYLQSAVEELTSEAQVLVLVLRPAQEQVVPLQELALAMASHSKHHHQIQTHSLPSMQKVLRLAQLVSP